MLRGKNHHMLADEPTVTVLDGEAKFIADHEIEVTTTAGEKEQYRGERIFINTGALPVMLPIPGLAEDNAKIAMSESEELDLKDLINKQSTIHTTTKYKLSSFYKRYNYDQAIDEAKSILSKGSVSTAQAQYLIWNIKITEDELDGAKVKVDNLKKLTQDERLAIELLVSNVYSKETDTESLYDQVTMSEADESVFELSIENERDHNKVISTKMMKTSDFAEER